MLYGLVNTCKKLFFLKMQIKSNSKIKQICKLIRIKMLSLMLNTKLQNFAQFIFYLRRTMLI